MKEHVSARSPQTFFLSIYIFENSKPNRAEDIYMHSLAPCMLRRSAASKQITLFGLTPASNAQRTIDFLRLHSIETPRSDLYGRCT